MLNENYIFGIKGLSQTQCFHYFHYVWSTLFCSLEQNEIGSALADALTVNQSLKTLN